MKKIIFILLPLIAITPVALGDSIDCHFSKGILADDKCVSYRLSLGFTDTYGTTHELSPLDFERTTGHWAVGVGIFDKRISEWSKSEFLDTYINLHVNHGSVARLDLGSSGPDFKSGTDTTFYASITFDWYPGKTETYKKIFK